MADNTPYLVTFFSLVKDDPDVSERFRQAAGAAFDAITATTDAAAAPNSPATTDAPAEPPVQDTPDPSEG